MSYTIYKISNSDQVVYVGQTTQFKTRIGQHFNTKPIEGQFGFGKFYGLKDSHSVDIITVVETKEEARRIEDQWQSHYGIIPESIRKTNGIMKYKANGGIVSRRQKTGAMKMNAMQILCEHCGKTANPGRFAQSHGPKCKLNKNKI
jgi:predicted GIY-YIG superfamily endonuclease